jgi:hypothetical protein
LAVDVTDRVGDAVVVLVWSSDRVTAYGDVVLAHLEGVHPFERDQ